MAAHIFDRKAMVVARGLDKDHQGDQPRAASGEFLQFLKDLFKQVLPALLKCIPMATPQKLSAALNSPNLLQRRGIRKVVRKNINDPRAVAAKVNADQLELELRNMAHGTTPDDAKEMMAAMST